MNTGPIAISVRVPSTIDLVMVATARALGLSRSDIVSGRGPQAAQARRMVARVLVDATARPVAARAELAALFVVTNRQIRNMLRDAAKEHASTPMLRAVYAAIRGAL
jgi:hypothetical protein